MKNLLFAGLALVALAATIVFAGRYSSSRPQHIGAAAADFTLKDSDRSVTLSQFRGQVVVLNFWATWCPPCVEETPSLVSMQQRMRSRGITVVGVSIDEDGDAYHRFLQAHAIDFITVRDPAERISTMYGTFGWPETYIIDRQGIIRRKLIGPVDWNSPEMTQFLSAL